VSTNGLDHVYIETHDYDATREFWRALGYTIGFETGHGSGRLDPPTAGPYLFINQVGVDEQPQVMLYLDVDDSDLFDPPDGVTLGTGWEHTHWGTRTAELTDPDGRTVVLEDQRRDA
jgi:catechol 2,3-dioxygenase-like lactoylglutathione lyase family enzyme